MPTEREGLADCNCLFMRFANATGGASRRFRGESRVGSIALRVAGLLRGDVRVTSALWSKHSGL